MPRMTGGEAIVASLLAHGIDTVFGLPGVQLYGLFDALAREANRIRVINARHEQGVAYMALGAAASTGKPAVYSVVPGPGVLNTTAALATAAGINAPVLCVTGQVPSSFLGRGRGHLHELPDQLATLRTLAKRAERIEDAEAAPRLVAEAFQTMMAGRRGPATLEMPWDKFQEAGEVTPVDPLPAIAPPAPDPTRITEAAKLALAAKAPLIVVGGGAVAAGDAVRALAERLGAPVVSYRSGRGVLGDDHPLSITVAAVHALWPKTDLVIGIGSRLEGPGWRWTRQAAPAKLIRIDIDPVEMRRLPADVALVADAPAATAALVAALGLGAAPGRREDVANAKRAAAALITEARPHYEYLQKIRAALPADGFLVDEMCQAGYTSWFAFPVHRPRTIISSGFQGTLGSGFPTALGVAAANPGRKVISITGDGGFLFGATELATAMQFRLGVTVIVFENGAYGNVKRDQQRLFEGRHAGADLANPDFVRFAESFGVPGFRVERDADFADTLAAALEVNGPALVHVRTKLAEEVSPWRFIAPSRP